MRGGWGEDERYGGELEIELVMYRDSLLQVMMTDMREITTTGLHLPPDTTTDPANQRTRMLRASSLP